MAHTNAWDETTPLGSENASTTDDYLRKHRLDLGERLEDMFYGFNAASNAAPENDYGIKSLKFYKQTSDPTAATDYSHVYVKLVDGVPELFYQDDENTTIQLTSGGDLYSSAGLGVAGASALVGNVAITGTLDVTGATEVTGVATLGDGSTLKTTAAPTAASAEIANTKYVDDQDTADHPAYSGGESHTDGSGMIFKQGTQNVAANTTDDVVYAEAFPNGIKSMSATYLIDAGSIGEGVMIKQKAGALLTTAQVRNTSGATHDIYWQVWGY